MVIPIPNRTRAVTVDAGAEQGLESLSAGRRELPELKSRAKVRDDSRQDDRILGVAARKKCAKANEIR